MILLGHRGFPSRRIAENTLLSFMQALQAGCEGIEFDVRLSKDGVPVIIHDENLSRIAGDARRVSDLTAKELAAIQLRAAGNIPTLNDVTTWIPAPAVLNMEIKSREATQAVISKLKTSAGLRERTIISSFHLDCLKDFLEQTPEVRRQAMLPTWFLPGRKQRKWEDVLELKPWSVGLNISYLNKNRVSWLHEHGVLVGAFEVRPSSRAAKKIVALGVDIAMTFRPDVARTAISV